MSLLRYQLNRLKLYMSDNQETYIAISTFIFAVAFVVGLVILLNASVHDKYYLFKYPVGKCYNTVDNDRRLNTVRVSQHVITAEGHYYYEVVNVVSGERSLPYKLDFERAIIKEVGCQ